MNLGNAMNSVKDWLTEFLNEIQATIMALLPDSPFTDIAIPENIKEILSYINWVVPFYMISNTLLAWTICIGVYYAYQTILRWIKTIE